MLIKTKLWDIRTVLLFFNKLDFLNISVDFEGAKICKPNFGINFLSITL